MINAIVVLDRLLQSVLLAVPRQGYELDTQLLYSLKHHNYGNANSVLTNNTNDVLVRHANDFVSVAIVYEDTSNGQSSRLLPPPTIRLIRQMQRHLYALDAVSIAKNILTIKQTLQNVLNKRESALKAFQEHEFCFIDAVMRKGKIVCAVRDDLCGPLISITDAAEMPVMVNYGKHEGELECIVSEGIGAVTLTLYPNDPSCNANEPDLKLKPPSLSHTYKHPTWTIHSSYGGKYSLCNLPRQSFSHADITFEGQRCKSGDICRFYFEK